VRFRRILHSDGLPQLLSDGEVNFIDPRSCSCVENLLQKGAETEFPNLMVAAGGAYDNYLLKDY
jgi:hypothetical protein